MSARARTKWADDAPIERAIELAKAHGMRFGGLHLYPDGSFRVFEATNDSAAPSDFDKWYTKP